MQTFHLDLKTLIKKKWKIILVIASAVYFVNSYSDIKRGIIEEWHG
jgi:hypothetical protein